MNIEIISGSSREHSTSNRVALFLQKQLQANSGHSIGLIDVRDWNLPFVSNEAWASPEKVPVEFQPLAARIFNADAFILVSPEYNGGTSPALKNLLDHFPKQTHKTFGIATSSTGPMGGIRASMQLQQYVAALFGILNPYMLITPAVDKKFDAAGMLTDESFQKNTSLFIKEFLWLAEKVKPATAVHQ